MPGSTVVFVTDIIDGFYKEWIFLNDTIRNESSNPKEVDHLKISVNPTGVCKRIGDS